ncbi:MAG: hypothetical protein HC836_31900 [Richelia sp. RM2_1_2]|nr:hypothetical protein [Richelia sp. RM2_1_2]
MKFPVIELICSNNGTTANADVLERSPLRIKVAMGSGVSSIALVLTKQKTTDRVFVGNKFGMEFTTTGKEIT